MKYKLIKKYSESPEYLDKSEDYVLLNKPCLSLTDVSKYYKALLSFSNENSMGLRNLVKSRI